MILQDGSHGLLFVSVEGLTCPPPTLKFIIFSNCISVCRKKVIIFAKTIEKINKFLDFNAFQQDSIIDHKQAKQRKEISLIPIDKFQNKKNFAPFLVFVGNFILD